MGEIHHLPLSARTPFAAPIPLAVTTLRPAPRPALDVAARRYVTVTEAAAKLAMEDATPRTIIAHLRALYDHAGLPDPENHRFIGGIPAVGAQRIHAGSRWDRGRFLAWLDNGDGGRGAAAPQQHPAPAANGATRRRLADQAAALIQNESLSRARSRERRA